MNELTAANRDLNSALTFEGDKGQVFNVKALVEVKDNRIEDAEATIEKALNEEPNNPYYLNNRGYIRMEKGEWELGVADVNESIRLDPENGWAYRNKGIYYHHEKAYDDALRMFRLARKLDKHVEYLHYYRGLVFQAQGQLNEACQEWSKSAGLNENPGIEAVNENCQSQS